MNTVKVVSFKIDDEKYEYLKQYAEAKGLSVSEIIRISVEKYLHGDKTEPLRVGHIKIYRMPKYSKRGRITEL